MGNALLYWVARHVRFTPESGRSADIGWMTAFDPIRTLIGEGRRNAPQLLRFGKTAHFPPAGSSYKNCKFIQGLLSCKVLC